MDHESFNTILEHNQKCLNLIVILITVPWLDCAAEFFPTGLSKCKSRFYSWTYLNYCVQFKMPAISAVHVKFFPFPTVLDLPS